MLDQDPWSLLIGPETTKTCNNAKPQRWGRQLTVSSLSNDEVRLELADEPICTGHGLGAVAASNLPSNFPFQLCHSAQWVSATMHGQQH